MPIKIRWKQAEFSFIEYFQPSKSSRFQKTTGSSEPIQHTTTSVAGQVHQLTISPDCPRCMKLHEKSSDLIGPELTKFKKAYFKYVLFYDSLKIIQKAETIQGTHVLYCISTKCFSFSQLFDCGCSFYCWCYDDLRLLV